MQLQQLALKPWLWNAGNPIVRASVSGLTALLEALGIGWVIPFCVTLEHEPDGLGSSEHTSALDLLAIFFIQ